MNYAYVTLLCDNKYINGVLMLNQSLKECESKYPLYCIVSKQMVNWETKIVLKYAGIPIIEVENIEFKEFTKSLFNWTPRFANMWKNTCTKFQIWSLIQFDKVVYLDADMIVLQNIDELFEKPHMSACIDAEGLDFFDDNHFNSGLFVCEPNLDQYYQILDFCKQILNSSFEEGYTDQVILNKFFKHWPKQSNLHLQYYYNYLAPHIIDKEDFLAKAKVVHFVGQKPWEEDWKNYDMPFPDIYKHTSDYIEELKDNLLKER